MVFSSHIFLFYFLPVALLLYYGVPSRVRHLTLTLLSYFFYGWWNPWFTLLMLGSTVVDYGCGNLITAEYASQRKRRIGLWISIIVNLAVLAFFKYSGFFAENVSSFSELFGLGQVVLPDFLHRVILPVGISFYTFQSMSYSIDLYRGHAPAARNFVDFACYVSMFPQLVAGPIVRYGSIADQLTSRVHSVSGFVEGFTRFNFGFAKKIILANPLGTIADTCFSAGEGALNPLMAWVGVAAYAFQIYFDFSAYSDMALGLGRMFGFRFPENFNSPYRAKSITDFWRRWHISLSSFLRDYLYIPLGGNRKGSGRTYLNLLFVMLIGGLWHGAQWTFVVWGGLHGILLAGERIWRGKSGTIKIPNSIRIAFTFTILLVTWVFFRAENLDVAISYLSSMFGFSNVEPVADLLQYSQLRPAGILFFILAIITTWLLPRTAVFLEKLTTWKVVLGLVLLVIGERMMSLQGHNPFLYFQF